MLKKINVKKIVSIAGMILVVWSFYIIGEQMMYMRHDLDLSILVNPWVFVPLLLVALTEGIIIILAALNFRGLMAEVSDVPTKRYVVMRAYATANIYKYIPGGFMYVVGRSRIAVETEGMRHSKIAIGIIIEGAGWIVAGLILSAAFAFDHTISYFQQLDILPIMGMVLGLVILASIPVIYAFRRRISEAITNIKNEANNFGPTMLIKRMFTATGLVLLWASSFLAVLTIMGQPMTINLAITVLGLYVLSWLIGFIVPSAPSGLGIREVLMLMFLGGTLNEGILLSAIVMHRALQFVGDAVAYGIASGYTHLEKRKEQIMELQEEL
ncbi:MAG: hypothetical protein FWC76_06010 [Defluviitaleaceae bacterium]|nr:hypothetical protein [Defluviitaleaceae bacterium]